VKLFTPLLLIFVCTACFYLKDPASKTAQSQRIVVLDSTLFSDTTLLMTASVREVYRLANYSMVWSDTGGFSKKADSLISFIETSANWGLAPGHYHSPEILSRLLQPDTDQRLMAVDVYLTDAFLALSNDLQHGRLDPVTFQFIDRRSLIDTNAIRFLTEDLARGSLEGSLKKRELTDPGYLLMRDSLMKLIQARAVDSLSQQRKAALIVNIERCHWKEKTPERYIDVNIPSFQLSVVDGDSIFLQSRVIVGKKLTPTPVLRSTVTSFLIYPYWHVPRSISTGELLPLVQKDSAYLAKHNYEVLDIDGRVVGDSLIDWKQLHANNFPYILRQREGRENALGVIKFLFDNRFGVYLHDTNGPRLFSRDIRALSHGCVRVQKARQLARYLVREDSVYVTPDDVDQYLSLQQRLKIRVPLPIPLFIRYSTIEAQKGQLLFYDDIYARDQEMLSKLSQQRPAHTQDRVMLP
jgi:L,D-transpeptidase YcbB